MAVITYEQYCREIAQHKFSPVNLLMGEEPFFIDSLTELFIKNVLNEEERDFNQTVLYGADVEIGTVLNAVRRFPMMAERQLVVIREAQSLDKIEELAGYIKKPLASTILVICYKYKNLDRRSQLYGLIEKNGVVFQSKKITDFKLPGYILQYAQNHSIAIDSKSVQMLADYIGNDLIRLDKEMAKLEMIMAQKSLKSVTPELIEENIGISKEYNNFELLLALANKDVLKANRIIQYFSRNPKNNPVQVTLVTLFNYFANLMICFYTKDHSEMGVASTLGFNSGFKARNYVLGLKTFKPMKVYQLIDDIRRTDAKIKGVASNNVSSDDLMKELIYKILH